MFAALFSAAIRMQAAPAFDFDLRSGAGLSLRMSGVPVVLGSGLQYYEPGWTKGYYSTSNGDQTVQKIDADTQEMTFSGAEGRAAGTERIHRDGDRLTTHYHLQWSGDHPVEIELTAGLIWTPALQAGTLTAEGRATRDLASTAYTPDQDMQTRRYAPDTREFRIQAPLGQLGMSSTLPMTLFDARGYHQGYAEGRSVWWYGALDIPISPGKPVDLDVVWMVQPTPIGGNRTQTYRLAATPIPDAQAPDEAIAPLIPKPRNATLDYGHPTAITNVFSFPAGRPRYWDLFKEMLSRRFIVPPPAKGAAVLKIDGGVSRLKLTPGAYTIDITPNSVSVLGEEDEGLRNGMYRLAQLAFARSGRLYLPVGRLDDEPHVRWRGVHLFGGPEAREFQHRLWDRVLLPLGMNKAVVECERTAWDSTPLDPSTHPMSREELAGLFDDYRKAGVEPIPLIQSLGHMDWFFAGKRRLDLAVNPQEPYTLDPRKLPTKTAIEALWDEAIDLLKPGSVHFGCDEVDMTGMAPHNPELTTDLWREQMATLGSIARKHGVSMMIWGDEGLAPGEAIDATNGDSKTEAAARRAAIPEGSIVCDWHYAADPDPAKFYPTLQLWKREELTPIAATWHDPENIRGFDVAAGLEHAGTLQTTWAGYDSSERNMIENSEDFVALVLAADYSWSERQESPDKLGYEPALVFRRMYFGSPSPVSPERGYAFAWSPSGQTASRSIQVGATTFRTTAPIAFRSILAQGLADAPTDTIFDFSGNQPAGHICLAVDAANTVAEGEEVATIRIEMQGGEPVTRRLVYGHHIRGAADRRLTPYADRNQTLCAVTLDLPKTSVVKRITIHSVSNSAGLRLYGITAY